MMRRAGLAAGAAAFLLFTLFPVYWAVNTSLQSGSALFDVVAWPADPAWSNYAAVFAEQNLGRNIVNSVLTAGLTVAASLMLGVGAAYALARGAFRGRRLVLFAFLGMTMFPQVAVLAGMFELINALGLYNSVPGLALSYLIFTLPFAVWALTTFMREIPVEIEEAAMVDGAGPLRTLLWVLLPLMGPGLATAGLLAFVIAWNEFLFALTFTLTDKARTVPVAVALISGASQFELPWGRIMAASVVVTVPVVAAALVFQRRIVAGLTAGAVKG